jgi:hypothetical protein
VSENEFNTQSFFCDRPNMGGTGFDRRVFVRTRAIFDAEGSFFSTLRVNFMGWSVWSKKRPG